MLRPIGIIDTHMECCTLSETIPVLTDLLAFEKVAESNGQATLKHPNTDWLLIVHESGSEAPAKQMHNHFGVRVTTNKEVDVAYEYLTEHKADYGLRQIGQPAYSHGSYSFYFTEPGTNGWEIECYEAVLRTKTGGARLGGVRAPHWDSPLAEGRFPGKGYIPQGFTHGTLACGDVHVSERFYREVLGLKVFRAYEKVRYLKHPKTRCFIVSAVRKEWKTLSPNFRFTLGLESKEAVVEAHGELARHGAGVGVTELGPLENDGVPSFLLRDPDRNCWEITSAGSS